MGETPAVAKAARLKPLYIFNMNRRSFFRLASLLPFAGVAGASLSHKAKPRDLPVKYRWRESHVGFKITRNQLRHDGFTIVDDTISPLPT